MKSERLTKQLHDLEAQRAALADRAAAAEDDKAAAELGGRLMAIDARIAKTTGERDQAQAEEGAKADQARMAAIRSEHADDLAATRAALQDCQEEWDAMLARFEEAGDELADLFQLGRGLSARAAELGPKAIAYGLPPVRAQVTPTIRRMGALGREYHFQ